MSACNCFSCGCCETPDEVEEEEIPEASTPLPVDNQGAVTLTDDVTFCRSAFLPESIRNWIKEEKHDIPTKRKLDVVMLALEIPEIRDLVDTYSLSNSSKVDYLSDELNYYMSTYFNIITSHGGDIISLIDCIITCIWQIEDEKIDHVLEYVLNTAITMQECYGENETKVGVTLTNRIGISLGTVDLFLVGNPADKIYYVVIGKVVEECLMAKSFCKSHQVVISPTSWKEVSDNKQFKWRKKSNGFICVHARRKEECPLLINDLKLKENYQELKDFQNAYNDQIDAYLHPLPKNSRTKQQMHILSAVSHVVVLAAYVTNFDLSKPDQLHHATVILQKLVNEYKGIFTKIVFDKNITFDIVFGCAGFKHINDQARGLMLSQKIVSAFHDMNLDITVGIATSILFSGILGPGHRLECALLGMPIFIAKTLVTYYYEYDIVCCINTYFRARREVGDIFSPVRKRIKGLKSTTVFFKVSTTVRSFTPLIKCVGRRKEKEYLINALYDLKQMKNLKIRLPLITIYGNTGLGKTHLVTWLIQESADMGYQLRALVANSVFEEPFQDAWHLLKQILEQGKVDTEEKILSCFPPDAGKTYPLHLLNKWTCTKFRKEISKASSSLTLSMMVKLTKKCTEGDKRLIVSVDNAEHMGTESWQYIQELLLSNIACVVVTFTEEFHSAVAFIKQLLKKEYLGIQLNPCDEEGLGSLACQFLNVKAIHKSFLKFLAEHSCGNALRLQEVLLLPPLQRHFCIVPSESLTYITLLSNFEMAEDFVDFPNAKVCDILDEEGLFSVNVPHQLLDVVKDHTCGLNPEEQMLTRKCSCLGKKFGLHILDAVCPEYDSLEMRKKVQKLIKKNVLSICCDHLSLDHEDTRRSMELKSLSGDFCEHPIKFSHEYLRKCIINSMPLRQREQLNLFLASLLDDYSIKCDSCVEAAEKPFDPHFIKLYSDYKIPHVDLRFCQCGGLRMSVLIQKEFHLFYGMAPIATRIDILLKSAGLALEAPKNIEKAEKLIENAKKLLEKVFRKEDNIILLTAVERFKAEVKLASGDYDEALSIIQQALMRMGIEYPVDFTMHLYKKKQINPEMHANEKNCLFTLCNILASLGNYEMAYKIIKYQLELILKFQHEFIELIKSYYVLLSVATKTRRGKKRVKNWLQPAYFTCYERLIEYPVVSISEFRAVAKLYIILVEVLFETNSLAQAESVGVTIYEILKQVKGTTLTARVTCCLGLIYFYNVNIEKAFEMAEQIKDAFQETEEDPSEAIYYILLVKLLRHMGDPKKWKSEVAICNDFVKNKTCKILQDFSGDIKVALAAKMATWANENKLEKACVMWEKCAVELYHQIPYYNYWVLSAAIDLLVLNIHRVRDKYLLYTSQQFKIIKWDVQKELTLISENVFQFCPVLQTDILAADHLFKNTVEVCTALKMQQ